MINIEVPSCHVKFDNGNQSINPAPIDNNVAVGAFFDWLFTLSEGPSGLKFYPGVGPEHSMLKDLGKVNYEIATDKETIDAFYELSRLEGIIPALESAHAVAFALKLAKENPQKSILINLSGRGDKDLDFVVDTYGLPEDN